MHLQVFHPCKGSTPNSWNGTLYRYVTSLKGLEETNIPAHTRGFYDQPFPINQEDLRKSRYDNFLN